MDKSTTVRVREVDTRATQEPLTVSSLLSQIGSRSIRLLTTNTSTESLVTATELVDVSEQLPEAKGTLLFVVSGPALPTGVLSEIAQNAASVGYAALVIKCTPERREEIKMIGENAGITILEVSSHVSWRYLEAAVQALLGERTITSGTSRHPSVEPLFNLVNTVAEQFGGSTVIEDLGRNVIAYSSVPDQLIDDLRTEGILTRRTPYSPFNDEQYRLVLRADTPIQFEAMGDEYARIALAVRAGSVPLGTLWAIDARPNTKAALDATETELLHRTVEAAGSLMLDNLRVQDSNQKPREALLRRLLNGIDIVGTEFAELGLDASRGATVTGFSNPRCSESPIALAQMRSTLSKHYLSNRDEPITVSLNDVVYVLVGTDDESENEILASRALPLIDRIVGEGSRAALAESAYLAGEVAQRKDTIDSILRCAPNVPLPKLLRLADVQPQLLVNRVSDLLAAEQSLGNRTLTQLLQRGDVASRELLETIYVWCQTFGNTAQTAKTLHVHDNTVRYRIRRATEFYELNLSDPDSLLAIWLQLRAAQSIFVNEVPPPA